MTRRTGATVFPFAGEFGVQTLKLSESVNSFVRECKIRNMCKRTPLTSRSISHANATRKQVPVAGGSVQPARPTQCETTQTLLGRFLSRLSPSPPSPPTAVSLFLSRPSPSPPSPPTAVSLFQSPFPSPSVQNPTESLLCRCPVCVCVCVCVSVCT